MSTAPTANPTDSMTQHITRLREYAWRVLVNEEALLPCEDEDRSHRIKEFISIGTRYRCTEKEMVGIVYRGLAL